MNIQQRIVLIVGALVIIAILLFTPRICYVGGEAYYVDKLLPQYRDTVASSINWQTVGTSSFVVIGATLLVWFALKSK